MRRSTVLVMCAYLVGVASGIVHGAAVAVPDEQSIALAGGYFTATGGLAMLVMHRGLTVHERYAPGVPPSLPQMLASGSKSFVGVAAVAAEADGLIDLETPACESLAEWRADPAKSRITYRQLLTMTSGLTAGERGGAARGPGWADIIAKPVVAAPGERFEYGAYHLNAFAAALERKLGDESFEEYVARRILDPLEIHLEWRFRCADGKPQVGGGAFMCARNWARFGEFMRQGGRAGDRQVVPLEALSQCLQGTPQNPAYGLTWWLKRPVPTELLATIPILTRDMGDLVSADWLPRDLYMAAGAGKQRLYVIPSLELVAVRQGDLRASRGFGDAEFLSRLLRGHGV